MYEITLFAHSWLRYFVLAAGLWLLVVSWLGLRGKRPWIAAYEQLHVSFVALLDTQVLLGLLLYLLLSPISHAAMANFGAAMKDATLRFWGVEHIATMLLALLVAHVGRARSKRKPEGPKRFRTVFGFQLGWLVLTLAAIPWPGLDIARPLLRF